MRPVIRLGDPHDHGGHVIASSAPQFTVDGIPIALIGDACSCPRCGPCTIVEGETTHQVGGVAVAYEGHRTSCGAVLRGTARHYSSAAGT